MSEPAKPQGAKKPKKNDQGAAKKGVNESIDQAIDAAWEATKEGVAAGKGAADELKESIPPLIRNVDWTIERMEEEMGLVEQLVQRAYEISDAALADEHLHRMSTLAKEEIAMGAEFSKPWQLVKKARRRLPKQPRLAYLHLQEARQMMEKELEIAEELMRLDKERHSLQGYCPSDKEIRTLVLIRKKMRSGDYGDAKRLMAEVEEEVLRTSRSGLLDGLNISLRNNVGVVGESSEVEVRVETLSDAHMKLTSMNFSSTGGYVESYPVKEGVLEKGGVLTHELYFSPIKGGDSDIVVKAEFVIDGARLETVRHLNFHAELAPVMTAVAMQATDQGASTSGFSMKVRNVDGEAVLQAEELLRKGASPQDWVRAFDTARKGKAKIDLETRKSIAVQREDGTTEEKKKEGESLDSNPGYESMWKAAFCIEPGEELQSWREWFRQGPFKGDELAKRAYSFLFELANAPSGKIEFLNDHGVLASTAGYVRDAMFSLVGMTINNSGWASYRERPSEFYQLKDEMMAWEVDIAGAKGTKRIKVREEIAITADGRGVERFIFQLEKDAA